MTRDMSEKTWRLLASDRAQRHPWIDRCERIATEIAWSLPALSLITFSVVIAVVFASAWPLLLAAGTGVYVALTFAARTVVNRHYRSLRVTATPETTESDVIDVEEVQAA